MEASRNSFSLAFEMEDYGKFQDKGVRGAASSQRAPNSPYRFGSGTGKKGGLTNSIRAWVQQKRIQFRDSLIMIHSHTSTHTSATESLLYWHLKWDY